MVTAKTVGFAKFSSSFARLESRLFYFDLLRRSQYLGLAKKTLVLPSHKVSHSSKQQTARENYG